MSGLDMAHRQFYNTPEDIFSDLINAKKIQNSTKEVLVDELEGDKFQLNQNNKLTQTIMITQPTPFPQNSPILQEDKMYMSIFKCPTYHLLTRPRSSFGIKQH